jgi:hypothetical protein
MKVDVNIAGIAMSASRTRALALVRDAIAKREAGFGGERPPKLQRDVQNRDQQTRGQ